MRNRELLMAKLTCAASIGLLMGSILGAACYPPATYATELLACVDTAQSRAEADACRARVDAKYGQSDAGGQ